MNNVEEINKLCRLCSTLDKNNSIEIFSEQGMRLNVAQIVGTHFWFQLKIEDKFPKNICTTCWWKVENFHIFYLTIKSAQESLIQKLTLAVPDLIDGETKEIDERVEINLEKVDIQRCENLPNVSIDQDLLSVGLEESSYLLVEDSFHNAEISSPIQQNIDKIKSTDSSASESTENPTRTNTTGNKNFKKRDNPQTQQEDQRIREWCRMECAKCSCKFHRFPDVKIHYRNEHKENGYIVCCEKKFFRRIRILEHISRHLNPNTFRCEACNKNFSDKPSLLNHMNGHEPPEKRPFPCDNCTKRYAKKFQLDQHRKLRHIKEEDKKFICEECGKAFVTNPILQIHIRSVHENIFPHICDICAKVFKSKVFFDQHCLGHLSKQSRVECSVCKKWLKHKQSLRSHMKRHTDAESAHICNICGKRAPNVMALRSHKKYVHLSDRSFKCTVCNKAFKKSLTLKEHMTLHTGEILYTCVYCPKTFNSSANMHSHKKRLHLVQWKEEQRLKINKNKDE